MTLDKTKEAELGYAKILDLSYASYTLWKAMDPEAPEISCESCESTDFLEYRIDCATDISAEDLQKILLGGLDSSI